MAEILKYLQENGFSLFNPFDTLYKYVSLDTAKKIIINSSLKFSNPSNFNDPFELSIDNIDFSTSKENLKSVIDRRLKASRSERRRLFNENKNKPHHLKKVLENALLTTKNTIGVCCFSKSHNKTLMWSHYADEHKGICLGFKGFSGAPNFMILHVKYIKQLEKIKYWQIKENLFPIWAYTKSHIWEYEEEVRAIHTERKGFLKFDKECLTEIHFGLRCDERDIKELELLLETHKYEFITKFKVKINPATFDVISKKIDGSDILND